MPSIARVFIIVPAATTSSPIKGAAALANALSRERPVSFVALKPARDGFDLLDDRVERVPLFEQGRGWPARVMALRALLRRAGHRSNVAVVSSCFSADLVNRWCRDLAVTCASVRGNLPAVYPETYGAAGRWLGERHLRMVRRLDHVVSMTAAMAHLVSQRIGRPSPIIGNFVDEHRLEHYRASRPAGDALRFVFTGSMFRNKQPQLVLDAIRALQEQGIAARLDVFGDGPLLSELRVRASALPSPASVAFHGHVNDPYSAVAAADALVLPSLTEGVSRSALEALFLGVPCVLRDVDGNSELIRTPDAGELFASDHELSDAMLRVARASRDAGRRTNLLPSQFRQNTAAGQYLALLEA